MKKKTMPKKMEIGSAGKAFLNTPSRTRVPSNPVMIPMKAATTVITSYMAALPTSTL